MQIANSTRNPFNNNSSNTSSTSTIAAATAISNTPLFSSLKTTLTKALRSAAVKLSSAALEWVPQLYNSQLPAGTIQNTNSSYVIFLRNFTYTNSNVFIPVALEPLVIENDNEIRLEHAPQLSKTGIIKVFVLGVMALLSLSGNVYTMWNIYKTRFAKRNSRRSCSVIYSLIFHLSVADTLVTGFCIIGEAAWCYTVQWLANDLTCKLVKLFQMFSLYLSTYVLVLIGVNRWIAVRCPMKSLNMSKICYRLLGGTYVLSLLLSLPQFFIFRVARGPFIEEFYQCVTYGFYTAEWQEQLYAIFTLVFTYLLPLCILSGTYMSIYRTIANSEKMFQGSKLTGYTINPVSQTKRQRLIHKSKMKSLQTFIAIILTFLICWTPYNVMMLIFMFWNPDKRFGEDLRSVIFFFGMSNSLVNPLIYGTHLYSMKRKTGKKHNNKNNGNYNLNRVNSQRTPAMLTPVTQVNKNSRQIRSLLKSGPNRTISSGNSYRDNIGILPTIGTSPLCSMAVNVSVSNPSLHYKHSLNQSKRATAANMQDYHNHSLPII